MNTRTKLIHLLLIAVMLLASVCTADAAAFAKKKKKQKDLPPPPTRYENLTGRKSLECEGVMNVIEKGDTLYLELPPAMPAWRSRSRTTTSIPSSPR